VVVGQDSTRFRSVATENIAVRGGMIHWQRSVVEEGVEEASVLASWWPLSAVCDGRVAPSVSGFDSNAECFQIAEDALSELEREAWSAQRELTERLSRELREGLASSGSALVLRSAQPTHRHVEAGCVLLGIGVAPSFRLATPSWSIIGELRSC
jgi:hypothetical protein